MKADDPRHGTVAGYNHHNRTGFPACGSCRSAKMRYEKARLIKGGSLKVPAIGTRRRIQALRALGYSLGELAAAGGWKTEHAAFKYPMLAETITAATAARVADVYERLCMTRATGPRANRLRMAALNKGWLPPLAWDNIDDPNEQPTDWRYQPADRVDLFHDLVDQGASISTVCNKLRVSRDTLEKWCERKGLRHLFVEIARRESAPREWRNQFTGGAA